MIPLKSDTHGGPINSAPRSAGSALLTRRAALKAGLAFATTAALSSRRAVAAENEAVVEPRELDDVLINPGIGSETFWHFQGDRISFDRELENFPRSAVAYFRYYWNELERDKDDYDFAEIDMLLAKARRRGQDVALRFMGFNFGLRYPSYLMKQVKGYNFELTPSPFLSKKVPTWAPDFDDAYFLERLEAFLEAFGRRYNGHPDLAYLDIGSVGRWGEWHMQPGQTPVPMLTAKTAFRVIDLYFQYWSRTPLCMLIGHVPGLHYAVSRGAGWRADSLGDYGLWRPTFSHMRDMYPQHLEKAGALDAWKRGPVAFEIANTIERLDTQVDKGGGYDAMIGQALEWHGSSLNLRARPLPDRLVEPLDRFLKQCGYRFVLRRFSHPARAFAGGSLRVTLDLENVGVAPPYKNFVVAVRLRQGERTVVFDTNAKLTQWLPGKHTAHAELKLPGELVSGRCELSVGVLDPHYREPEVKLAIAGRASDGWYPMNDVTVERA